MKFLNIGCDKAIMDEASDVRQRLIEYGKIVEEFHIHTIAQGSSQHIANNVWVYPVASWIKSLSVCGKIIREKKIDVIISPDPFAKAWVSMILACIYRKKLLLSVYGGNIFDPNWIKLSIFNRVYSWFGRVVFWYAHAIQTDGLETYEELKKRYGTKVFWKPMIPANIQDLLAIERKESRKVNILYIGRLIIQKNIPLLVKVINSLKNKVSITVVGDGPLKKLLPMSDLKYFSYQNRNEIVERFKESDMLVLTSYYEGFARVIMEAALSGIPIVTTKVSGIKDIVDTRYVFEQGDEIGFINSIRTLIEDQDLRKTIGLETRERAQKMLSIDRMMEQQQSIFDYLK